MLKRCIFSKLFIVNMRRSVEVKRDFLSRIQPHR